MRQKLFQSGGRRIDRGAEFSTFRSRNDAFWGLLAETKMRDQNGYFESQRAVAPCLPQTGSAATGCFCYTWYLRVWFRVRSWGTGDRQWIPGLRCCVLGARWPAYQSATVSSASRSFSSDPCPWDSPASSARGNNNNNNTITRPSVPLMAQTSASDIRRLADTAL